MSIHLHHAYGVVRNDDVEQGTVPTILNFLAKEIGFVAVGNPDFHHMQFETLTIDDSREIKEKALARKFSAEMPRVFLIEAYGITREAQNALLKLFEEPEPGNHFFLILPSSDILLPTLRSRLSFAAPFFAKGSAARPGIHDAAKGFLGSSIKDKIAAVDALAADISDGKEAKHAALSFLNSLEYHLYAIDSGSNGRLDLKRHTQAFQAIACARSYMNDRAPSIKMLLEYVALSV